MKSALKAGILALSSLIILLFAVLWLKGKAVTGAERITVSFKDVNGMREGSAVQMMGVRIGQVEEIIPQLHSNKSYVDVKFVITEPDIDIPRASEISIQQSGIIGEQFLEITPPRERIIYLPEQSKSHILHADDRVEMLLSGKLTDIGIVKKIEIVQTQSLPIVIKENIKTKNAYKIRYIIDLPGLVMPDMIEGIISKAGETHKLRLSAKDNMPVEYPDTLSVYTVIEPMRIADFLELQKKSAKALIQTNERISLLLSDDVISDLQKTASNVQDLSEQSKITMQKAQELIELSTDEIISLTKKADRLADNMLAVTDNLNKLAGDKDFVQNAENAVKSFTRLSDNVSSLLEDPKMKCILDNAAVISKNTAELSNFVNEISKNPDLKRYLKDTVNRLNSALDSLKITLDTINYAAEDKDKIKETVNDISEASENLRKFSEKLNKRFLLFRLLF